MKRPGTYLDLENELSPHVVGHFARLHAMSPRDRLLSQLRDTVLYHPRLTAAFVRVGLLFADLFHDVETVTISYAEIADLIHVSPTTSKRACAELARIGFLTIRHPLGRPTGRSTGRPRMFSLFAGSGVIGTTEVEAGGRAQ